MKTKSGKSYLKGKLFLAISLAVLIILTLLVLIPYLTFIYYSAPTKNGHLYFSPEYYSGQKIANLKDQAANLLPKPEKRFTSHLLDFSLSFPPNYLVKSESKKEYEFLSAAKENGNYLSLTIFPVTQGCIDTEAAALANGRWSPVRVKIGGKYPMTFNHWSISHGESGHTYEGVAKANENYCIAVTLSIDVTNEKEFINLID